jgi:uncharacterized RDD family membrane protein YckC
MVDKKLVQIAPFWKRLLAWVYDLLGALGVFILALVLGQCLLYLLMFKTESFLQNGFLSIARASSHHWFWFFYLFACIQYYYVWCWVKGGQTVGMRAWGLRVYKNNGQLLTYKDAYWRSFLSLGGLALWWFTCL